MSELEGNAKQEAIFDHLALEEENRIERKREENRRLLAAKLEKKRRDTPPDRTENKRVPSLPKIHGAEQDEVVQPVAPAVVVTVPPVDKTPGPHLPLLVPRDGNDQVPEAERATPPTNVSHEQIAPAQEKEAVPDEEETHFVQNTAGSVGAERKGGKPSQHSIKGVSLAKRFGRFWKKKTKRKTQKIDAPTPTQTTRGQGIGATSSPSTAPPTNGEEERKDRRNQRLGVTELLRGLLSEMVATIEQNARIGNSPNTRQPRTSGQSTGRLPKRSKQTTASTPTPTRYTPKRSGKDRNWQSSNSSRLVFKAVEREQTGEVFEDRVEKECEKVKQAVEELVGWFQEIRSKAARGFSGKEIYRLPQKIRPSETCAYKHRHVPKVYLNGSDELWMAYNEYKSLYREMQKEMSAIRRKALTRQTMSTSKRSENFEREKRAYKSSLEDALGIFKQRVNDVTKSGMDPKSWPLPTEVLRNRLQPPPKEHGCAQAQAFKDYLNRLKIIILLYEEKRKNSIARSEAKHKLKKSIEKGKTRHLKKERLMLRKKNERRLFQRMVDIARSSSLFEYTSEVAAEDKYLDYENSFSFFRWKKKKPKLSKTQSMLLKAEKKAAKVRIMQVKRSGLAKIRRAVNGGKYQTLRKMKIKDISKEVRKEVLVKNNQFLTPEQNQVLADNMSIWGGEVDEILTGEE
eukprot:g448.t1